MSGGFQLSLPGFDGSLEELPSVVSTRQLALDDIPLASIPSQFLAATDAGDVDLDVAGEVLAATARLMLMKSVHLLAQPVEEEEDDPGTHGPRQRDETMVAPALMLATRQNAVMYPSVGRAGSIPRKAGTRPVGGLADAWKAMLARERHADAAAAVPAFVRLEVAMGRIVTALTGRPRASLQRLLGRATRREAVMGFLAALELVRRNEVQVEQREPFGEITLGRTGDVREDTDRAG